MLVCRSGELKDGDVRIVAAAGREIGVFLHAGQYYAYENVCVHQGGPACEGIRLPRVRDVLDEQRIFQGQTFETGSMHFVCPWHGYEYDLLTGECAADRRLRLRSYSVAVQDGNVIVEI